MASLSSSYQVIDDSGTSAGAAGSPGGGSSGFPLSPVFTATSIANAVTTAWLICSALQRPGRLVAFGGNAPWTLITGNAAAVALTAAPSGTGY